ncbi:replication protein [Pseudomonas putida]|uniref:Phage replication protein O n=2 Tax=Pseudomonas TaxID=286 RepID=Q88G32_PSEPK|nr:MULTISPECIES: replication protein [Pseudomonas]AAN69488.1 putative Phage replication protein O [Pseudomonas putida KT2440]MDD2082018.1 replication protein [Pseudomonas putida]PXZ46801.1 replication protein [Pseudomonas sp. SMT-1]QDW57276.1 replication protein [Pseudomonas sp. KBS0802]QXZ06529.1 replication protein [Pseudomonas putida]
MSNVTPIQTKSGFTRMNNDLYEALIGAELSGRELRVALAIHRLTAGYNQDSVKVAALYVAKMMYPDEAKAAAERANVSRAINSLIRQRVLFRDGGSRDPITFLPVPEWRIDSKPTVLKSTHCVENTPATVLKITHIKDRNTNTNANALVVDASASTGAEEGGHGNDKATPPAGQPMAAKVDKTPYARIVEIYNQTCGHALPQCLKLNDKRRTNIRNCWNLKINGVQPFRSSEFWAAYFRDCLTSKHYTGSNDRGWTADIEFLTRETTVLKVLEAQQ